MAEIQLGWKVKDAVSGIVGIAVARIVYLNGCVQYCVVPPYTPGALEVSSFYIDEPQLKKVSNGVVPLVKKEERRSYGNNIKPQKYGIKRA